MGLLTDYFRAADQDAARVLGSREGAGPLTPLPGLPPVDGVEAKGIEPVVVLGSLISAITGEDHDEDPSLVWPDEEAAGSADAWVVELPASSRDALASLDDALAPAVAARWATAEELAGATGDDLHPFVADLVALARRAAAADEQLYCWMSL
jgi:hypothetical protein